MENEIIEIAKKKVKKKKDFYNHLAAFVAVGLFFFAMNMVTSDENPRLWFFFPMLPWGIGLAIHYFTTFGFPWDGALSPEWEEAELRKEIEKVRNTFGQSQLPPAEANDDFLDLNNPPAEKEKRGSWNREDLV